MLALDNPLNDPDSTLVSFLTTADFILTAFFTLEVGAKIISYGLIFNGPESYLKLGANMIDMTVVVVSLLSYLMTSKKTQIIKIFRLLKVLRPLRVISRNRGLKIGIQALYMALPSILNIILVSLLFFMIIAIIGINFFKGTFFSCYIDNTYP